MDISTFLNIYYILGAIQSTLCVLVYLKTEASQSLLNSLKWQSLGRIIWMGSWAIRLYVFL